jgi:hypothetical protein
MLSHILKPDAKLVPHLLVRCRRQVDTSWLGEGLEARGNVHAIPIEIPMLDDHIAQIDADPKREASSPRHGLIAIGHPTLDIGCAPDRIDHTGEFDKQAIAGRFYNPAGVFSHGGIDQLAPVRR